MAIIGLTTALVVSNATWLYMLIDAGVSYSYLEDSWRHARGTALQALALLPAVADKASSRETILAAATIDHEGETFDKEGFTWIGDLGLKFDGAGVLVEARPAVEPF